MTVADLPVASLPTRAAEPLHVPQHRALRAALRDFYDDYALALDDLDLEGWVDFFVEDCHYRVIPRENVDAGLPLGLIYCMSKDMLRDRVTALRQTTVFEPRSLRHFIGPVRVREITGSRIRAEANFAIVESLSDREPTLNLVGTYVDELEHAGHGADLGFALVRRDCVVDNYRIRNSLIVPV